MLAALAGAAGAAGGTALPATAAVDQPVLSATIFPGTGGNASTQPVLLSTLASCPLYGGPPWTFSDGQGPQVTGTLWSLAEILTCGLSIPQANVTAVKVLDGDTGQYESTLTPADVFNTDTYPSGALPLISIDGSTTSGGSVTYSRPPANPGDQAQSDQFTEAGTSPVAIDVYENRLPLNVAHSYSSVSTNTSSEQVTLAATVTDANGAPIDPSQLTWSWTFAGSPAGSAATPTVTIAAGESELATVLVTDPATGAGGTATFDVAYNPTGTPAPANNPGPGSGHSPNGNPTGQHHGQKTSHNPAPKRKLQDAGGLNHAGTTGAGQGASPGGRRRHPPGATRTPPTRTPAPRPPASGPASTAPTPPTTTVTTTTPTPAPTTTPGLTVDTTPTRAPRRPRPRPRAARRRASGGHDSPKRLVTGRLVADVQALPAGASPLVHPVAAAAAAPSLVRAASDSTSAPTWAYAALAVLALLGGGALYERRGRRGRSLHR